MQATTMIERLLDFAIQNDFLCEEDRCFGRNALLYALRMEAPDATAPLDKSPLGPTATQMLDALADFAVQQGIIQDMLFYREQFAAHLMGLLTPPPSEVTKTFRHIMQTEGAKAATDSFYTFCRAIDYIRVDQIARNQAFPAMTPYGELEITINLSKPEKDPREIALQKFTKDAGYPQCMLCVENEGYAGRPGYSTHETLRTIPVKLGDEHWRFQYSPYSYYNEHCIVLNEKHKPMAINRRTFTLLFSFLDQFPHYFIGSNADLPIVGGSILSHDHFQGGKHVFPMDKAAPYACFAHPAFPEAQIEAVSWPMTCLRLSSKSQEVLIQLADSILGAWRKYNDPANEIISQSKGEMHNTITPIARKTEDGTYILQLVLRNNRTSPAHPLGIFHPHSDLHHIKRENIGLIEVMGLFILPGRLETELDTLTAFLTGARPMERPEEEDPLAQHFDWVQSLAQAHGTKMDAKAAMAVLHESVGEKCARVLYDCGVFKLTYEGKKGLATFLESMGIMPV